MTCITKQPMSWSRQSRVSMTLVNAKKKSADLFCREEPGHVLVGARGHDLALALQVGLDHAQLPDPDGVVETDETNLAILNKNRNL